MIDTATNALDTLGLAASTMTQPTESANGDLGRADFLELMLAQIKNQDPLKPMQGEEFVAQLAQFSTVQGIENLNSSFSSVASALQSNQFLQASALVGQNVSVPSDVGYMDAATGLSGQVDLPAFVPDLTVKLYDQAGQLVRTIPMGAQEQGLVDFTWEGLDDEGEGLAPGIYGIVAEGTLDDQASRFSTYAEFAVDGVIPGKNGDNILLSLAGIGAVPFDQVMAIHQSMVE